MARKQVRIGDRHGGLFGARDMQGSSNVFANGRGVHRRGDRDTIGWQVQASVMVFANSKGCARQFDRNNWGAAELTGSPDVLIE